MTELGGLTKAQRELLIRLRDEDSFGTVRNMAAPQKRVAYNLKDKGLVMLDGAISSSITEGNSAFNGMTFVITEAGRRALSARSP